MTQEIEIKSSGATFGQFGKSFQEKLVQALLVDQKFSEQMMEVVDTSYFEVNYLKFLADRYFASEKLLAKMKLVSARFLWRHGKYAILIAYVIAAVITPTGDPFNQTIFAAPMIGLYFLSIIIAWVVNPRQPAED